MRQMFRFTCLLGAVGLLWSVATSRAQTQNAEFRAFWVDAWHEGFQSPAEVRKLIAEVRAANGNAIFIQVRKRGDAFYKSGSIEPAAAAVTSEFDPLAEAIREAHDTNAGPRIEVHAWVVMYPVTTVLTSNHISTILAKSQPTHPFNLHPEWMMESEKGSTFDGADYSFDPGHPAVQKYLFGVVMNIISRYDIDGIHLDHVRYPGASWGYNPISVARFNTLFHRTGKPRHEDSDWKQFRRDQVTALVRKIYLSALALKPSLKISASTITWVPAITTEDQWRTSMPFQSALQDWQSWMKEGILDMNVPMAFFKEVGPLFTSAYENWTTYAKDHQYNRHVIIGQAGYLNSNAGTELQLRLARSTTAKGNKAQGIAFYSYAVPVKGDVQRRTFFNPETGTTNQSSEAKVLFEKSVPVPEMPWKVKPTTGHVMGYVWGGVQSNALDGASITLSGPVERKLTADGTGFFGAVDLPPGRYALVADAAGYQVQTNSCTVELGRVCTNNLVLLK